MPKIIQEKPPNFSAIKKVFPLATGYGVIFAYAPDIYAPYLDTIPPELIAHETVHIERQLVVGVENWWAQYLSSSTFRYEEELLAHRAEYQYLAGLSRQLRRSALKTIAKKLAAPLYRYDVSLDKAMRDLAA